MSKFDFDGEDDMGKPLPGAEPEEQPWTCDTCKKPCLPGEPTYGLAVNRDARTTRHWDCHKDVKTALAEFSDKLGELQTLAAALERSRRR